MCLIRKRLQTVDESIESYIESKFDFLTHQSVIDYW